MCHRASIGIRSSPLVLVLQVMMWTKEGPAVGSWDPQSGSTSIPTPMLGKGHHPITVRAQDRILDFSWLSFWNSLFLGLHGVSKVPLFWDYIRNGRRPWMQKRLEWMTSSQLEWWGASSAGDIIFFYVLYLDNVILFIWKWDPIEFLFEKRRIRDKNLGTLPFRRPMSSHPWISIRRYHWKQIPKEKTRIPKS